MLKTKVEYVKDDSIKDVNNDRIRRERGGWVFNDLSSCI